VDFAIRLDVDVRVYVEREGQPLEQYAVMLQVLRGGEWQTIRLYDNAHGVHDMHRYIGEEKQNAEVFHHGTAREACPAAILTLQGSWQAIVEGWEDGEETAE
jgi:hypothetical protein